MPGETIMRMIGHITVKSNSNAGVVDAHFGIRLADKDVTSALFPIPYQDNSNWMWQERVLDNNLLSNDLVTGVANRHRFEVDVSSRRRLRSADERAFFYCFNSDATDSISFSYHLRILLALP